MKDLTPAEKIRPRYLIREGEPVEARIKGFGKRVLNARIVADVSLSELRRRTGINQHTIRCIESGKHSCHMDTAARLCKELGLSLDYAWWGE